MSDANYNREASQSAPWRGVPCYDEALDMLADHIAQELPPHGRVLDIGTGGGEVIKRIARRRPDARFDAFDLPGAHGIEQNPSINIIEGDLETVTISPGTYHAITASLSLHHLSSKSRQQAYDTIIAGLKPRGTLAVFDVYEVGAAEERAFRKEYIRNAGKVIGVEAAATRYDSVVGREALHLEHVPDSIKDQYPDRQVTLQEAWDRLAQAGLSRWRSQVYTGAGEPQNHKMKLILGKKKLRLLSDTQLETLFGNESLMASACR